jgi:hypothetical protein
MATKNYFLALSAFLLVFNSSCKKNSPGEVVQEVGQDTISTADLNMTDVSFPQSLAAGQHRVIAGLYNSSAQTDGNGSNARFLTPGGIFVNPDGSLLVVDADRDVRKIVHDTVVTSIHIPLDPDGFLYTGGADIAATKDGTIAIVGEHEYWLYTPDGVSHYHGVDSHDEIGLGVDRDPSGTYFWYTNFTQLLAVKPNNESISTKPLYADIGGFTGLSASNNGVKYFTTTKTVNKYTKTGVSARIFTEFVFENISSIASSRDGFKVYIADKGDIKMISNNSKYPKTIKTILSGQNVSGIALSNSEKYIYYSTGNNTINKLAL